MSIGFDSFDTYVIKSILTNNQFGITEVKGLKSLNSIFFIREEYEQIEKLIKSDNIKGIRKINENQPRTGEYLDVMEFKDQNQKRYIVTVYDSNMLEQDPEVIKIYSL